MERKEGKVIDSLVQPECEYKYFHEQLCTSHTNINFVVIYLYIMHWVREITVAVSNVSKIV